MTLGHRLALVELAEVRRELELLAQRLADLEPAFGGDVVDLRDRTPERKEAAPLP